MAQQLYVLSSADFDGTTALTTSLLTPARGPGNPIVSATQSPLGRLSFHALARAGEYTAVVQARRMGGGAGSMAIRSVSAAEVAMMSPGFQYSPAGGPRPGLEDRLTHH